MRAAQAVLLLLLCGSGAAASGMDEGRVFDCASTAEVHAALHVVSPGDTIRLEGGRVYQTAESFRLHASGREDARITFTSHDPSGQGRFAIISTVDQRKEEDLVAISVKGAYWTISRIEIAGTKVPLEDGYWDVNGFRLGMFLNGPGAHHVVVEDIDIHGTHNAAIAVRDRSHHNQFRRLNIHHIGEWLHEDYNAHEGEGFYLGSSKNRDEAGDRARVHDILIEDSVIGPGLLGQFLDIKYGTSFVTARNNVLYCENKSYNEEVVELAGYANLITDNDFVGSNRNLTRYIHVFNKKSTNPVRVEYKGKKDIPSPTGRDNTITHNRFYTDDGQLVAVESDLRQADQATLILENNRTLPFADWKRGALKPE